MSEISETSKTSDISKNEEIVTIQLGDIIEINAPTDPDLNLILFYVDYVDVNELRLVKQDEDYQIILSINSDGRFNNEAIIGINILSRAEYPGFAMQNDLVVGKWIDIHFGGDVPTVITGTITNLEEDRIEIKTIDNDTIYIDFAYKGIPLDLPIEKIVEREIPDIQKKKSLDASTSGPISTEGPVTDSEEDASVEKSIESQEQVKEQIREMIFNADQVFKGEKLGKVTYMVEVSEDEKVYGIDKQTTDLLDQMLSRIPNIRRTDSVLKNIHKMIDRFKELRKEFSVFDENNNIDSLLKKGSSYKPLVDSLLKMKQKLYWLIPVTKTRKKLYNVSDDIVDEYSDIESDDIVNTLTKMTEIVDMYNTNQVPGEANKYIFLIRSLKSYLTSFDTPLNVDNTLANIMVHSNITSVVDNLDDFYSSVVKNSSEDSDVNSNIGRKKFYLQNYGLGTDMTETHRLTSGDIVAKKVVLTNADIMYLKSFLFLPEPLVRFSRINLPSANIMTKSSLNMDILQYWALLNEKSSVNVNYIDNIEKEYQHNADTFLQDITEYCPDETIMSLNDDKKYEKFLKSIIPRTKILFDNIKKDLEKNNTLYTVLSIHNILSHMEPFLIYNKDLTFNQYSEIKNYVDDKIRDYKKRYAKKSREMAGYSRIKNDNFSPKLLSYLQKEPQIYQSIVDLYELQSILPNLSDAELLNITNNIDNSRLLNAALTYISSHLMVSGGIERLDDMEQLTKVNDEGEDKHCSTRVLAKKYLAIDEMEEDNNKEIYFDKQFDKTYYDVLNDYKSIIDSELAKASPDANTEELSIQILAQNLVDKQGTDMKMALRDAEAMLVGKRKIVDGDYAQVDIPEEEGTLYYVRKGDMWERDTSITDEIFSDTNKLFCNLDNKCFSINNECLDSKEAELEMQRDNISKIMKEFDNELLQNASNMNSIITKNFEDAIKRIDFYKNIERKNLIKYQVYKNKLAASIELHDQQISPVEALKNIILGQSDLVKKYSDIVKFTRLYTRPYVNEEDPYWLYCISTGFKLLPVFISRLATVFVENGDYIVEIEKICKEQGTISDDGESWVDKHSGYVIKNIDFNVEENYNEDGYKEKSRDLMEIDLGNMIQSVNTSKDKQEYLSVDADKVTSVTKAMAKYLYIDIENDTNFIVRNTLTIQAQVVQTKEKYERMVKAAIAKGKKNIESYEKMYDASLLIISLCYLLISIQTSIPNIITRKTHPGCKQGSLFKNTGFILDGTEDKTALIYIACVANKIKSSIEPWNSIKKSSETSLIKKMNAILEKYVLATDEVKLRIKAKQTFIIENVDATIPSKEVRLFWTNFLPPLIPIKINSIQNIGKDFKEQLKSDIQKGSAMQLEKIGVIKKKIILYSLSIQDKIQTIVSENAAILTNSMGEAFMENACCDNGSINAYKYFVDNDNSIEQYNKIIYSLQDILSDLQTLSTAAILFDPLDTKYKYPELPSGFSEETIYLAFITFCKFNSHIPPQDNLLGICMEKPSSYNKNDTLEENIKKMKREGRNYSKESFDELMNIVNRNNIVNVDLQKKSYNIYEKLREFVGYLQIHEDPILDKKFTEIFKKMLDSLANSNAPFVREDTEDIRNMRNFLDAECKNLELNLIDFIKRNTKKSIVNQFQEQITIEKWLISRRDLEESTYNEISVNIMEYMKNTIDNLTNVFPNIIINKVEFQKPLPSYMMKELSSRHVADITNFVNNYYSLFSPFKDDQEITNMLEILRASLTNINILSSITYVTSSIYNGANTLTGLIDMRMGLQLYRYYLLTTLTAYMKVIDKSDTIIRKLDKPDEVLSSEVFTSEQLLEEATGNISELELASGEKEVLSQKMAKIIAAFTNIIYTEKTNGIWTYDSLMDKLLRSKEKEKDRMTDFLKELSDEQREIENVFKNHKLGKWNAGLQKGFREYRAQTYDKEREDMDKFAILEKKLQTDTNVTELNKDIYEQDILQEERVQEEIDIDEMNLSHLGEDDDYGELDGDEFY